MILKKWNEKRPRGNKLPNGEKLKKMNVGQLRNVKPRKMNVGEPNQQQKPRGQRLEDGALQRQGVQILLDLQIPDMSHLLQWQIQVQAASLAALAIRQEEQREFQRAQVIVAVREGLDKEYTSALTIPYVRIMPQKDI